MYREHWINAHRSCSAIFKLLTWQKSVCCHGLTENDGHEIDGPSVQA